MICVFDRKKDINQYLYLLTGAATRLIIESWDILQVEVAKYINADIPGVQKPMGMKPMRGLCQRLKGNLR